jgi:hypothetical protein
VAQQEDYYGSNVDPSDHKIEYAGTSFTQHIKEAYDEVEKGKRGCNLSSIQDGAVHLTCQLIAGKLIRKGHPT